MRGDDVEELQRRFAPRAGPVALLVSFMFSRRKLTKLMKLRIVCACGRMFPPTRARGRRPAPEGGPVNLHLSKSRGVQSPRIRRSRWLGLGAAMFRFGFRGVGNARPHGRGRNLSRDSRLEHNGNGVKKDQRGGRTCRVAEALAYYPAREPLHQPSAGPLPAKSRGGIGGIKKWGLALPPAPTVPSRLVTKPGRRGSPLGGFEAASEPGARAAISGVLPKLALLPVSPRAPRQGRSPGGSPFGRSGTGVPFPTGCEAGAEARFHRRQDLPWPKPRACLTVHRLASWVCRFAAPGPKPGPARRFRSRSPFSAGDSAPTFRSRFLPGRRRTEVRPCLDREPEGPRPWAFHEACHSRFRSRTSPQLPHGGGFVSRPGLHSAASSSGGTRGRFAPAVAGKAFDLAIDRLGHGLEAVMDSDSDQGDSDCG